ncbi:MAG TPA: hypothetical protein ENK84_01240 [Desulfobulbus sp.]|nr:hypothetical protein [Desulfobulbus sp.]
MQPVTFRCACCRRIRPRNLRVKNQRHCGDKRCQQARKTKWEREKLQADPYYRINKKECQERWKQKNPDYWQQYRQSHPEYRKRNRRMQHRRDQRSRDGNESGTDHLVKMDTLDSFLDDTTESYFICPARMNLAKMDALEVKIIPVSNG